MTTHLITQNLSKNFDGLLAVDRVNISFQKKKIHAIIGPNGAGKTTLINLLSGEISPSLGCINFKNIVYSFHKSLNKSFLLLQGSTIPNIQIHKTNSFFVFNSTQT